MRLAIACFVLITLCLPVSAGAVGKSTVDPNAKVSALVISDADASQRVTYKAKRKTVVSILAELSAMTGVILKAGYNNEDWQVRDRRMNIFAKDLPLSSLMNSIARVMKFQWSKSEYEGVVSYRLFMDRKTILGAESKRLAEEQRVRKGQLEGRQRFLSAIEVAGRTSGDDAETTTRSSYASGLASSYTGLLPRVLAESPPAKQAFLSGEQFDMDVSSLSPELRQDLAGRMGVKAPTGGAIVITALTMPSCASMAVFRSGHAAPLILPFVQTGMGTLVFDLKEDGGGCTAVTEVGDPDSALIELDMKRSDAILRNDSAEIEKLSGQITKAGEAICLGEPLNEHPDDPALSAKVKMSMEGHEVASALAALAESSSFAVVSDSLQREFGELAFHDDKIEIKAALGRLESVTRCNWERHGSTLELHDRDWYSKRAAQVPEAWLEAWRKAFKSKDMLDIGELSEMAGLTKEQVASNIAGDDVLEPVYCTLVNYRELLRMYAALDRAQRASIFTEDGLALDSLSDKSLAAAQEWLKRYSSTKAAPDGGLRLMGRCVMVGKSIRYDLRAITPSGEDSGVRCAIECPTYVQPAEKKI